MRFLLFILDGRCDKRASVPQFSCLASELQQTRGSSRCSCAHKRALPQPRPALPCPEQLQGEIRGGFGIRRWIFCMPELPAPPWKLGMQRSHPSWSWSPGAECARQGQGSAPGLCWEAQSRIKHSPPAWKGGDQSCHCWKNRAGKKNPSSPCLACSTACLGFVSLGSQRSLLQSPECVWLLNSAAQKGDQDLFASPGQILLL